jgi:hypothetical protein
VLLGEIGGPDYYDPISAIALFWNFYPEMPRFRLAPFYARKPFAAKPDFDNPLSVSTWLSEIDFTFLSTGDGLLDVLVFPDEKAVYQKHDTDNARHGIHSFSSSELIDIYENHNGWMPYPYDSEWT